MQARTKTVGLLRFSVLTSTYYSETYTSLDQLAAHLFAPARMELRFRLFETLCLPSLTRQTDADFACVVMTAEDMPAPYLERLAALIEPHPNLVLRPVGTGKHYPMLRAAYDSVPLDGATHRILFRLDDDDALDLDFIRRTRSLAHGLLRLHDEPPPTIIAHNRGYYVKRREGGNEVFDAVERAPLSAGVTLVAPTDHGTNPYRFNHRKFAQHYNTYSEISVPGFIRTIHGDNKSNPQIMGLTHQMQPGRIAEDLIARFGVDIADLRAL